MSTKNKGVIFMTIKEIREITGLTQREFANRYDIPLKTLQHWEGGRTKPASYLLKLIIDTIPQLRKPMEKIYSKETGATYYYNEEENAVYDCYGQRIPLNVNVMKVAHPHNLPIYLDFMFEDMEKAKKEFITGCNSDQKNNIEWEMFK